MNPPTVLVTGAGGAAGVSVIRALQKAGHRIVAADLDPLAAGSHLADEAVVLPPFRDPTFVDNLCKEAVARGATVLISTMAEEMVALADAAGRLTGAGLRHWLPDPEAVTACIDKWRFAEVTTAAGRPVPATGLGRSEGVPGPWIVKPRFGRGSRDVCAVDDREQLEWALGRVPDPIVQTRLEGREFTVDALTDRSGRLLAAVPRWRLETKAGISTKGRTFDDAALISEVGLLLEAVGLRGAANIQGFVADGGAIGFVEINPRFSGGLPLSLAAGADLVNQYVAIITGRAPDRDRLTYRPGVTMVRHYEEIFLDDSDSQPVGADRS